MLIRIGAAVFVAALVCAPAAADYLLATGNGLYCERGTLYRVWFDVADGAEGLVGDFHLVSSSTQVEFHADRILRFESGGSRASFACLGSLNGSPGWLAYVHLQDAPAGSERPDWVEVTICGWAEYDTAGPLIEGYVAVRP